MVYLLNLRKNLRIKRYVKGSYHEHIIGNEDRLKTICTIVSGADPIIYKSADQHPRGTIYLGYKSELHYQSLVDFDYSNLEDISQRRQLLEQNINVPGNSERIIRVNIKL